MSPELWVAAGAARWVGEPPWVPRRLHSLERKMEPCHRRGSPGRPRHAGRRRRRGSKQYASSKSSARSSAEHGTMGRVTRKLGDGEESVRAWVRQADIDDGHKPCVTSEQAERIKAREQGNRALERANEILHRASALFAAELDRLQR